jgi:multiple sugar transport system ATP-binding protein
MNLYESTLSFAGGNASITIGSQNLELAPESLAARPALRGYDGKKIAVGIRPEDFEDAEFEEGHPESRTLTAPVTLLEALGSEIMVHFRLDAPNVASGDPDAAQAADADNHVDAVGRFNPRSRVRSGQPAKIAVATENLHFFDLDSRQAIWD